MLQGTELPGLRYGVLLIVTDGIGIEYQDTKRKLSLYSDLPFSIIVVGVGEADCSNLRDLFTNYPSRRKNTTFIELRNHQQDPTSLARAALKQIPAQVIEYMSLNGIAQGNSGS